MKIIERGDGNTKFEKYFKPTATHIYKLIKPKFDELGIPFDGILIRRGKEKDGGIDQIIFSAYKAGGDNENFVEYTHDGIELEVGFSFTMRETSRGRTWDGRFINPTSWHQIKDEKLRKKVFKTNQQRGAVMHTNHSNTDGDIMYQIDWSFPAIEDNIKNYLEFIDEEYRLNFALETLKTGKDYEIEDLLKNLSEALYEVRALDDVDPYWKTIFEYIFEVINNGKKPRAKKLTRIMSEKGSISNWLLTTKTHIPCEMLYEKTNLTCYVSQEAADLFLF